MYYHFYHSWDVGEGRGREEMEMFRRGVGCVAVCGIEAVFGAEEREDWVVWVGWKKTVWTFSSWRAIPWHADEEMNKGS